jgi:NADPH:quinone reductase-like Zn-dependent oxidoreductase
MRAIRASEFGPPSVLRLASVDTPTPESAQVHRRKACWLRSSSPSYQVLVRVHATSVTPLDTYLRMGVKVGAYSPVPPYIPGNAMAGVVVSKGTLDASDNTQLYVVCIRIRCVECGGG